MSTIQVLKPKFHIDECLEQVRECLEKGWTGSGFKTAELETKWKEYTGHENACFLNSNTSGLHLAVIHRVKTATHNFADIGAAVEAKDDHRHRNAGVYRDAQGRKQHPVTDQQLYHHRSTTEQFDVAQANLIQNSWQQLVFGHDSYNGDERADDNADQQTQNRNLYGCPQTL